MFSIETGEQLASGNSKVTQPEAETEAPRPELDRTKRLVFNKPSPLADSALAPWTWLSLLPYLTAELSRVPALTAWSSLAPFFPESSQHFLSSCGAEHSLSLVPPQHPVVTATGGSS